MLKRGGTVAPKGPNDFMNEVDFDQAVIEMLTLALMRLTCTHEKDKGTSRYVASTSYDVSTIASLIQQGLVEWKGETGRLDLTADGFFFGDVMAARIGMTLLESVRNPHAPEYAHGGEGESLSRPGFTVVDGGHDANHPQAEQPARPAAPSSFDPYPPIRMEDRPPFDPAANRRENDARAFRVRIELDLEGLHPCWREIEIPATATFLDLHVVIQRIFNWYDEHLFSFKTTARGQKLHIEEACFLDPSLEVFEPADYAVIEAAGIRLGDVFPRTRTARYDYDYGDGWEHKVKVVKTISNSKLAVPRLVDGAGDAPPEDVGGPGGFERFLQVVANPKDPDHESMLAWAESQMAFPFDLAAKQRELAESFDADRERWMKEVVRRNR